MFTITDRHDVASAEATGEPALTGIKIVDLGQFYFAPYCATLLARMGADVIKVEAPAGDPYRRLPTADADGMSLQFSFLNAGKRTICLDLKSDNGKEVLRRLARWADVLVQNLAPGAMDRFGLGYEELAAENPRLIMASGTGFGSYGPYSGEPAMDLTIQARTAIMSTTGEQEGPPLRTGPSVVDFMAATHLAAGVLAALYQRTNTGRGQHVEVSLQDAIIPSLTSNLAGLLTNGALPERTGNRHGGLAVAPYNAYPTVDGWITVLCPTDGHWQRLCALMADPAAANPRFADMRGRCAHMDEVDELVGRWTGNWRKDALADELRRVNVPSAPVVTLPELIEDPHVRQRPVLQSVKDAQGTFTTLGSPVLLSDSPATVPTRPGALGEHTEQVLTEELGYSAERVAELFADGVA